MKLRKLDLESIKAFAAIISYNLQFTFEDKLFEKFFRKALEGATTKLVRAAQRISRSQSLQLTEAEAICLKWAGETMLQNQPNHSACQYYLRYFPTQLPLQA